MSKAVSNFVDTVIQHFPPFRWDEEQERAWVGTMVKELACFSDAVLDRAIAHMIRTRKQRSIPLVAECIEGCLEARKWVEADTQKSQIPEFRTSAADDWSTERVKLAYDLIKSSMGKQAAKDSPCWVLSLWNFCRKNQRLPVGPEIDRCKRDARDFDEAYAKAVKGGWPQAQKLEELGASMLARRKKLAEEVLGK